jgi:hypothetical protein
MKIIKTFIITLSLVMLASGVATGASDTATLNISAAVNAQAKLTVGSPTVTFADADPDTTPSITATEAPIAITAKVKVGGTAGTLTWIAADDLKSGTDTIAITNVTWTATGANFVPGTLSKTAAQTVATFVNSGHYNGTITPLLANSWNYKVGNYTAASTVTLTAP